MLSILAGIMIAVAGIVYLQVGGVAGSLLFSMGLLTVLSFKLNLFTGKAGLLATNEISVGKLADIWVGNLIGTTAIAFIISLTPIGVNIAEKAQKIVAIRITNGPMANLILGIGCGLLMYVGVKTFALQGGSPIFAILPVSAFILAGFNHCVADMFYLAIGSVRGVGYETLIPTTLGNIIGCNLAPSMLAYANFNQRCQ